MNRSEQIRRLANEEFDLCIIGGGASGAGCALDAALRGLRVALIEKTDFASETSSKSTKLVHGGVRYLEQAFKKFDFAQLRQVRHGLEERHIVLKNAPHLAHSIGLITPVFNWLEGFYYTVGLKLYDLFASKNDHFPSSKWLSKKETMERMPGLNSRIHSAVLYYDGQLDDARYCLALIQSAAECKAAVANHIALVDFSKDSNGKIVAAQVKDQLADTPVFEVRAKQFLNCTGPFSDHIRQLANPDLTPRISPSKGVHIVLPIDIIKSEQAMLIPKTKDGRMVFALPFEGKLLVGTTDEPYTDLETEPFPKAKDLDFLIETIQPFLNQKIEKEQVISGFGGIRPLIKAAHPFTMHSNGKQTKALLRDHEVELDTVSGLVSLLGGKWTTYRLMARDAINVVMLSQNSNQTNCATEDHRLVGAEGFQGDHWKKIQEQFGFDIDICQHLASNYGGRANIVAEISRETVGLQERIAGEFPFIKAEIIYAARFEMAHTIRDFLARRVRLEILNWETTKVAVPIVAKWMGQELVWNTAQKNQEIAAYIALLDHFIAGSKSI